MPRRQEQLAIAHEPIADAGEPERGSAGGENFPSRGMSVVNDAQAVRERKRILPTGGIYPWTDAGWTDEEGSPSSF